MKPHKLGLFFTVAFNLATSLSIGLVMGIEAQESDWIGLSGPRHSAGFYVGLDNDDYRSYGADINITLANDSTLTMDVQHSSASDQGEDFDIDRYLLSWSTDPYATWSLELGAERSENNRAFETDELFLALQYFPETWSLKASYVDGSTEAFYELRGQRGRLIRRDSVDLDHYGVKLALAYYLSDWSLHVDGSVYRYDRDLSQLNGNTRLLRILATQTLSQIFSLLDWQLHLGVSYRYEAWDLALGAQSYETVVSADRNTDMYFSATYQANHNYSLGGRLASDVQREYSEQNIYAEFFVRKYW